MLNVIIRKIYTIKRFVEKCTHGFDRVVNGCAPYTPEKTAEITWVACRQTGGCRPDVRHQHPALFPHGMGKEHLQDASSAIQARLIITAICANIDVRGAEAHVAAQRSMDFIAGIRYGRHAFGGTKEKQIGASEFGCSATAARYDSDRAKKSGRPLRSSPPCGEAHAPSVYRAMLTGKPYPVRAAYLP